MTISISQEKKESFNKILEELAGELGITKTQFENLASSYKAVGTWLNDDENLKSYDVNVYPQGSFRLGTIIQPINEKDDLDIDLVCRLTSKPPYWTQEDLKESIGDRLKANAMYSKMIKKKEGGRRCWTLLYRENNPEEKYHLDVLPAVVDKATIFVIDEMARREYNYENVRNSAIRITDKEDPNYATDYNSSNWLKSFPDGYAAWFVSRCKMSGQPQILMEAVAPIGKYVEKKTVLQKAIQILKRHRDTMFGCDDDKPISIIITTLASLAYRGETTLIDALIRIASEMELNIKRIGPVDWIANPVNPEENFADKWPGAPQKRENFYRWLRDLKNDLQILLTLEGQDRIYKFISDKFGERVTRALFENMGSGMKKEFDSGKVRISKAGTIGSVGVLASHGHTFYGS